MEALRAYLKGWRVSALCVTGCIPVALSNSEGVGSVRALVRLTDAHLYIQVLGNERTARLPWFPPLIFLKSGDFARAARGPQHGLG
jgi:hypothetical protein